MFILVIDYYIYTIKTSSYACLKMCKYHYIKFNYLHTYSSLIVRFNKYI